MCGGGAEGMGKAFVIHKLNILHGDHENKLRHQLGNLEKVVWLFFNFFAFSQKCCIVSRNWKWRNLMSFSIPIVIFTFDWFLNELLLLWTGQRSCHTVNRNQTALHKVFLPPGLLLSTSLQPTFPRDSLKRHVLALPPSAYKRLLGLSWCLFYHSDTLVEGNNCLETSVNLENW